MSRLGSTAPIAFWIIAILVVWSGSTSAGTTPSPPGVEKPVLESVHERDLILHRDEPIRPRIVPDRDSLTRPRILQRIVYGYYPYWVQDLTAIRWNTLSHLAWFSVEIDANGDIEATHGWPDTDTVETAQAAGVRVDLTFTLFSGAGIQTLCGDPARRANAITNMVDQMEAGGADGISVDFEGLLAGTRDDFTTFIMELRQELEAREHLDAQISIAGPAVDWTDSFDLDALLDWADWYFIMGYGYFWSGSSRAGPVGMLRVPSDWRPHASRSMLRTLADYSRLIPATKRRQVIHGVPYYGREWLTASDALGAATSGHVGSVTYSAALEDLAGGAERRFHPGVKNPWYSWQDGGQWHQVWYDDEESLAAKYALALDQDLGGVGMWALNYDRPHAALWDLLETKFGQEPVPDPGHRLNPIPIDAFPFQDVQDTAEGPGSYFNYYSCDPDLAEYGREWVYEVHLCQPGTLTARVPDSPDADPDLHLLSAPDQEACLARAHLELSQDLQPGNHLLVVDTFVDDAVEQEGPFTLDVEFEPSGGQPCPAGTECREGECVCPQSDPTLCSGDCVNLLNDVLHCGECDRPCPAGTECLDGECICSQADLVLCAGACVNLQNDELHCGECDRPCPADHYCITGECTFFEDGGPTDGGGDGDSSSGGGCGCSSGVPGGAGFAWLIFWILAGILRLRSVAGPSGKGARRP